MASAPLIPKNGAVSLGSYVANYNSFGIEATQSVEGITGYGSNVCSANAGSGTPDFSLSISAFGLAHATGTAPALPGLEAAGIATVFTMDTGCTETMTMIRGSVSLGHGRMRAAVPMGIRGKNAGDVTEAYATT